MNRTKIEWVKNPDGTQGYTWNPITGCLNHTNGLCEGGGFPCYAYRLANGRLRQRYLANKNTATDRYDEDSYPFYPRFWPDRLYDLLSSTTVKRARDINPRGIFVCDMSDLFGVGIPEKWTQEIMETIKVCRWHRFYLLTKQPQNLIKFSPFPDNCWVGVTATNTRMALEACLKLGDIEASVRYLSIEPMLNEINLPPELLKTCKIAQLIIGAQTKPYKPPKIEWVKEIVEAADKAGIPVFMKNNLIPLIPPFGNELFPPAIRVRQEMPS